MLKGLYQPFFSCIEKILKVLNKLLTKVRKKYKIQTKVLENKYSF